MDKEFYDNIKIIITKEQLLNEIIVWLKAKGLWEECQKSLSIKIIPEGIQNNEQEEKEKMDLNTLVVNINDELNNKYINSDNPFIKENSYLIVKYTDQLSKGQITQNQYEGYVVDIQRLAKLEELEQVVEKKAIYQGFMNMIQDIILNGIVAIMKAKNI
jgi:hypothetical protein